MKFKFWRPLLAGASLVCASLNAAECKTKILVFGDSLTAGFRLPVEKAFPNLLEKQLQEKGFALCMVNAGVSGDTTAKGLARVAWSLKRQGPFHVVLLALGANDGLQGQSLAKMETNLKNMIQKFADSQAQVVLLGMKMLSNRGTPYAQAFEAVYKKLSGLPQVSLFVPFLLEGVALKPELNLEDLMHPNEKGHQIIANNLEKVLFKFLQEKKLLGNTPP